MTDIPEAPEGASRCRDSDTRKLQYSDCQASDWYRIAGELLPETPLRHYPDTKAADTLPYQQLAMNAGLLLVAGKKTNSREMHHE